MVMRNGLLRCFVFAGATTVMPLLVQAAVPAADAAALGVALTEFGAEKAANADGSIPAYTGGLDKVAEFDARTATRYVDPFKDEKPLFSIDAKNADRYEALLAPGTKELMRLYPEFRLDVYPSHRTMRYTSGVLQNTLRNATTAKLGGAVEGDAIEGADKENLPFAGIPFPIPRSGYEVMWNHTFRFSAAVNQFSGVALMIDSVGSVYEPTLANVTWMHPWYDTRGSLRAQTFDSVFGLASQVLSPPKAAGAGYLAYYPTNTALGQKAWFYVPGQRRVRPAPDFSYDSLMFGAIFWDEITGFLGRMDRFDFKLVGKREMLVPYNVFGLTNRIPTREFAGKKFVNSQAMRWERHRVWIVDSVRKPAASHLFARRTFYVDEDCWCVTQSEAYDTAGTLVRVSHVNSFPSYATGGINVNSWTNYDLAKGGYYVFNAGYMDDGHAVRDYETAEGLSITLSPQALVGSSQR